MKRFVLTCWLVIALGFLTGATQQPAVRQVVNGTGSSAGYYAATGSVISPTTAQTLDATTVLTRKDKVTAVSSNTTLGVHNVVYATIGSGGITLTLPAASSTTVGSYRLVIADTGVGNLTLAPNGSDKLNGVNSSLTQTGQYTGYEVLWISSADGWYVRRLSAASGTGGTVTSIATTSPITGGTITGSGTIACATCAVTGSPLSQFAATTSAQLAGVISDETGTGLSVFNTAPAFIGPITGTNSAALPFLKFGVDTSNYGAFFQSRNAGDFILSQGSYYDGVNYLAQTTESGIILLNGGAFYFINGTSLTSGNEFSPTARMIVDTDGSTTITNLASTGAATGKTSVCADSSGKLFRSSSGVACAD